ncbi:Zinc finger, CCHC-type [Trema orientale]|uniref:Zinc finger, CCHC-type n=1 Tax=Trema orientale TaxID=63057 RepID=A0A2P5D1K0_TREOI|nr:Zinc finger, CCHC-type [Trema orientale]
MAEDLELELEVQVDDVDEVSSQVEHISLEDLSFALESDETVASEAISKSLVGRFLARRLVSNSLLRAVMGKIWKPKMGWKMQEVAPGILVFCFTRREEAEFILENCPWSPCDGFFLLMPMPADGLWKSADMNTTPIWVRAYGFPLSFMTEQNVAKVAGRFSKVHEIDPTQRNGMITKDHLRFMVDICLDSPIQAGFSLPRQNAPRVWIYFKYERLPITCYRCGIVGHVDQSCTARAVKVLNGAGKSVDLYGPWLRQGHRLDHCFSELEISTRKVSACRCPRETMETAHEQYRRANPEAYRVPVEIPDSDGTRDGATLMNVAYRTTTTLGAPLAAVQARTDGATHPIVEECMKKDNNVASGMPTAVTEITNGGPSNLIFGASEVADLAARFKGAFRPPHHNGPSSSKPNKRTSTSLARKTLRSLPQARETTSISPDDLSPSKGSRKRKKPNTTTVASLAIDHYTPGTFLESPTKKIRSTTLDNSSSPKLSDKQTESSIGETVGEAKGDESKREATDIGETTSDPKQNFGEAEEAGLIMPLRSS